jgi:hypothetical protein
MARRQCEMSEVSEQSLGYVEADVPLRVHVAARRAFPDGTMTASGLRREAKRGRLVIERIAGKDYTTLAHIERMRRPSAKHGLRCARC